MALIWQYRAFFLRVCLPIYLLLTAFDIWLRLKLLGELSRTPLQLDAPDPYLGAPEAGVSFGQLLSIWGVWAVAMVLMAVLWHRHVLAACGIAPTSNLGWQQPLAYVVKFAGIWILVFIPIILILGVGFGVLAGFGSSQPDFDEGPSALFPVLAVAVFIVSGWALMRLSLALPEAAIGQKGSIFNSWVQTRPLAGALWVTAGLEVALFYIIGLLGEGLEKISPSLGYLGEQALFWGGLMVGISILTLLYERLLDLDKPGEG